MTPERIDELEKKSLARDVFTLSPGELDELIAHFRQTDGLPFFMLKQQIEALQERLAGFESGATYARPVVQRMCEEAAERGRAELRPLLAEAVAAAVLCEEVLPNLVVRSWPPGFQLKTEALKACRAVIAAAVVRAAHAP